MSGQCRMLVEVGSGAAQPVLEAQLPNSGHVTWAYMSCLRFLICNMGILLLFTLGL